MEELSFLESMVQTNLVYVKKIPTAIIVFGIAYLVLRVLKSAIDGAMKRARLDPTLRSLVTSAVNFFGWILILAAVLNVMDLGQLSLALGGSIALIAMALATGLNNVTQDLLSGIFLLGDPDFGAGKLVRAAGVEGRVVQLSVRKTKIIDKDGNLHTIPNRNVDGGTYVTFAEEDDPPQTQAG